MNQPPNREGLRIAQLFRKARGLLDQRQCKLDQILAEDDLELIDFESSTPGCAACLIRSLEGSGGGIFLAPGQSPARRRFSIAHELGHYHIPRHKGSGTTLTCADADLRAHSFAARQLEWEANDFAAELLMPRRCFSEDVGLREISFNTAIALASNDMYAVSTMAVAWRVVQVTREPCALVVAVEGRIEWVVRSSNFSGFIAERGQQLSPDSCAAAVFRGERATPQLIEVVPTAWFERDTPNLSLFESNHSVPSQRQVVSLLWQSEIDE